MDFIRKHLLPRIIQYLVIIFIGITIVFIIPRFSPSDPVMETINRATQRGKYIDPSAVEELKKSMYEMYGLAGGPLEQYFNFWKRLVRLDFGPSLSSFPDPVMDLIKRALPWTAGLMLTATLIGWIIGNIIGGLAGYFSRKRWARILEIIAITIRPIPYYIVAFILVFLFAYIFPVFPLGGGSSIGMVVSPSWGFISDIIKHAALPVLTLVMTGFGVWFLPMRSLASSIASEDFVKYAEFSGLPRSKILYYYVMRNAMLPQVTGLAILLGNIFGGTLIIEYVFAYPGLGMLLYEAVIHADYNLIMGITVLSIIGIATGTLIIDLIYPILDPRIRSR